MRIGILTGGGDCPGLNAVLRAAAKTLITQHNATVFGFYDGWEGVIENRYDALEYEEISGILTLGGTILGTSNKANPLKYYKRNNENVVADCVKHYQDLQLDGIIALGGDGTMSISYELMKAGINVVGCPKTIDNDLMGTDITFGFDTAVSIATEALDRIQTTAQSHHRILIVETMGRYAGWIALHAGVASGSDIVLIPEIPYNVEKIVDFCLEREARGQRYTLICVAEGAKPIDGEITVKQTVLESHDPIRLGGVANALAKQLEGKVPSEIRTTILGHVQRGGTPTAFDRVLSTRFGVAAAEQAAARNWGVMVALQSDQMVQIKLNEVAHVQRLVTADAPLLKTAKNIGISFGV